MSDELTELPEGWEWTKLGELGRFINGDRGKNYPSKESFVEAGIPFINAGHLDGGTIQLSQMNYITEERFNLLGSGKVEQNDILYCLRGSLGKTAIVKGLDRGAIASSLVIIRSLECSEPEYLLNFLISPLGKAEIRKFDNGSAQPNLSARNVGEYSVPIPPLNEQKRIVAQIEALRERSQKAKAALEAIPELCDRFRQSVLAAAFRGDLTADWREENPDVEPASVLLERIRRDRRRRWEEAELKKMQSKGKVPQTDKWKEKYKEPEGFEAIDGIELPALPEGWLWLSTDECTSWITDGEHATPERSEEGVYLLSARNVLNGSISLDKVDFIPEYVHQKLEERLKVEAGDVLLSCSGTVGRSCVVPVDLRFSLVRSVAVLKPLLDMGEYLSLALRSPYVQQQIENKKTQTAQSNIFQGRIKTLAIPVAPLDEQYVIIQLLSQSFEFIESVEKTLSKITEQKEKLNQSILAKAFRGELVDQDPNDEPAAVLLERIRAERAAQQPTKKKQQKGSKRSKSTESDQIDLPLE